MDQWISPPSHCPIQPKIADIATPKTVAPFLLVLVGGPFTSIIRKARQLRTQKNMRSAHINDAPSSRPLADPLSWITLDLQGWTPCMHISVCLPSLRSSSGRMNLVLGGASQSAAPLCEGCAANCLRHSHLVALPHHRSGRPTHPEGSRASLWRRGFASQHRTLAWARFRARSLAH